MNKYNQLREGIILAVPEIMEWKNGCKVLDVDGDIYDVSAYEFSYEEVKCLVRKIIGRDITPIDILKTRKDLAIDSLGGIFIRNHCNKKGDLWEMEYCGHYDIGKPLQDQSDECKELLWDLICNK